MLHVRVVSPAEVTGRLVDRLTADPGVINLVVLRAAATRPDGDAVQFDLARASANSVLRQLREFGALALRAQRAIWRSVQRRRGPR